MQILKNKFKYVVALLTLGLVLIGSRNVLAAPATFTVTNTNDTGAGSLRQAITDANSNSNPSDVDVIEFNITGTGLHTISFDANLPAITEPLAINGYSQPGSSANTAVSPLPINAVPTIVVDGTSSSEAHEMPFHITSTADGSSIRGLVVYGCDNSITDAECIRVGANNVTIAGNFLGVSPDGMSAGPGDNAGSVYQYAGTNLTFGGLNPADRNITANDGTGQQAVGLSSGGLVQGNYIGIAKDGVTSLGGVGGISVSGTTGSIIGGTLPAARNLISGASEANIVLTGQNSIVQGNYIGTDYTGEPNISIAENAGIAIAGGATNLIGGTQANQANVIAGVGAAGVLIMRVTIPPFSVDLVSTRNAILGNSIHSIVQNMGMNTAIGYIQTIDNDGDFSPETINQLPRANDIGDSDTGVNDLMNFPVLNKVTQNGDQLTIDYDLDTADSPSNEYRVEFFASDAGQVGAYYGDGMGQRFLGAVTVSPGASQSASLTLPNSNSLSGQLFSATVTAVDSGQSSGFGSTSRFSMPIQLTSETQTTPTQNNNSSSNSASLASTGQSTLPLVILAATLSLIGISSTIFFIHKRIKKIVL